VKESGVTPICTPSIYTVASDGVEDIDNVPVVITEVGDRVGESAVVLPPIMVAVVVYGEYPVFSSLIE